MQTAGKLLPEEDVPQLAQLITEILAITPGAPVSPPPPPALRRPLSWQRRSGAGSTAADVDKAVALGEAVGEAMLKRGGPKVTPMVKAPSAPAADPVAEDRQRQIDLLEAQKQEAVAAERCALPPPSCRSAVPDGSVPRARQVRGGVRAEAADRRGEDSAGRAPPVRAKPPHSFPRFARVWSDRGFRAGRWRTSRSAQR